MSEEKAKPLEKISVVINSISSLAAFTVQLKKFWIEHKHIRINVTNMRSLSQNALKAVWYKDISDMRGDCTAKDVERECKLVYGTVILRRRDLEGWLYERTLDRLPYEKRLIAIDGFAVTSAMSSGELKEYLDMMHSDYPYLECKKKSKG